MYGTCSAFAGTLWRCGRRIILSPCRPSPTRSDSLMRVLITGAAGFIGSTLADRLLSLGHAVVGVDNFITGQPEFLAEAKTNPAFLLKRQDLLDLDALVAALEGVDVGFHFAASSDVSF